jgi:hypothetical protein
LPVLRTAASPATPRADSALRSGRSSARTSSGPSPRTQATLCSKSFAPELAAAAQTLRNEYGGSAAAFWADFTSGRRVFTRASDPLLQNVYATAAAFSEGVLPIRVETGELLDEAWQRWLAWDPVRLARARPEVVRGLRAVWIDAGRRDEYRLDLAAQALHEAVVAAGAPEVGFELYEGGHRGASWRFALSLPWLVERLR